MNRTALRLSLAAVAASLLMIANPGEADAKLAFFRNYPDLKWNVIKTEHFNVFYPESRKEDADHYVNAEFTARKTAYVAEEMYPLVCGQFNYYLDETVNIVMLDQTDSLTGYTVPSYDWIVVSGRHSDYLWRLRGHHDWLRNVMYHEFAHVVSLKADHVFSEEAFGASVGVRWNDGRINTSVNASAFIMKGDPWFWVEGGAEYYTDVAGINTWTSNRDMRMRMDTLEGTLLNFDDMGDYMGSNGGFDGNRHYLSGYSFALYLEERFGEGVYQSFALNREEGGWTPNWLAVIEETLNISADDLYDDWRAWAKAKYEKVRDEVMEEAAIGSEVAFSRNYWDSLDPANVEKVEFVHTYKGNDKYKWRKDREKANGSMLQVGHRFSPDGSMWARAETFRGVKLNFATEADYPAFNPEREWADPADSIRSAETGPLSKVLALPLAGDGIFDFSPDGKKIVTVCSEDIARSKAEAKGWIPTDRNLDLDGYRWHQLCVVDLDQVEEESRALMVDFFGYDPMERDAEALEMMRRGVEPPKDADKDKKGKKWKQRHWVDWANGDDYLIPVETLGKTPETRVSYPSWSPDGRHIAFVRYADAKQELWLLDLETQDSWALTNFNDGTHFEMLDWSPDGSQIVAGIYRWNQADIYLFSKDGKDVRPLTMDRFEDREPHWGYDGNIYFTSDRVGGIFNIFRINPRLEAGRLDRDLDGILDSDDQCPDERETRNLFRDSDGCPDGIPVRVTADKVEISEKVFFELDAAIIKPESYELLNALARVVLDNPQVIKIEVGGHTDSQGEPEYNLELSQRRAEAVRTYLLGQGLGEDRLTSQGFGDTLPLIEDETEEAFAANRRVEFTILEQEERSEIVEMGTETPEDEGNWVCGTGPDAEILENAYLVQLSNVVGGAFTPSLTPTGNLFYSHYSSFGWKPWGLHCSDFHNKVVDDTSLVIEPADYKTDVLQEVYPDYSAITAGVPVHAGFWRNPLIIPIINISNVSLTHVGVDVGVYFSVSDALDTNDFGVYAQVGETLLGQVFYTNKRWFPEFSLFAVAAAIKFDYGFNLDDDGDLRTTDDQFLADVKLGYAFAGGGVSMTLPFSSNFTVSVSSNHFARAIQGVTDGKRYRPLDYSNGNRVMLNLVSPKLARSFGYGAPNPRGGRALAVIWSPSFSVPLNENTGGVSVDDGQLFTKYFYNEVHLLYSEYISLPIKKPNGEDAQHTLQLNGHVGFIDRNVPYRDEIRGGSGGGINRSNLFQSTTNFAGYGPYTLSGETVGMLNLQYRFPIARNIDVKVGPLYIEGIYAQFFGTVGNFWSYKVKDDAVTTDLFGERVLADEEAREGGGHDQPGSGVVREWPGMIATENGWPVLADAGLELRFVMNLFNRARWYSSIRVAYGFMGISGRGDVDGDDVYTNSSDPTLDNRSDEREPAGFRFMVGIGSGW